MLSLRLHISPPAPTTMARPIIVALAVMAERDGCRVMLPCARSPVPSLAKTRAIAMLRPLAIGRIRSGATSTSPTRKSSPPSATSAKLPLNRHTRCQRPPSPRRSSVLTRPTR